MDAFWCAYLGVPPVRRKGDTSPLPVLSAVVLDPVAPEQEAANSSDANRQIEELREKNKALEDKNLKLKDICVSKGLAGPQERSAAGCWRDAQG